MKIEFHRLEGLNINKRRYLKGKENIVIQSITCSFKTDRLGIVQVVGVNKVNEEKSSVEDIDISLSTTENEPDINVLRETEKTYVTKYMTAVLLLTFYAHKLYN